MEEHHEAFFVWHYLIKHKHIPDQNNMLLHIDSHDDMGACRYRLQIPHPGTDLQHIEHFTYTELNIDNFIVPAFYTGIFSYSVWVKPLKISPEENKPMYVRSFKGNGKRMFIGHKDVLDGRLADSPQIVLDDIKYFTYHTKAAIDIPENCTCLIDIDLDYFSCILDPKSVEILLIEITKEEYNRFHTTRYNRLRYTLPLIRPFFDEENDKYYYEMTAVDEDANEPYKVSEQEIESRIKDFVSILLRKNVIPTAITFCRSRISGYTPPDQWRFIENTLIRELSAIYSLHPIDLKLTAHS